MRPALTALAPCLLLCCLGACGGEPPAAASAPSLTVSVARPLPQELPRRLVSAGSVTAHEEMLLGVELSGQRVAEVLVEVGDVVRAGQPLLRLDTRSLGMELRQAEAALAQANASLAMAEANARRGEALKRAQLIAARDADELIAGRLSAQAQVQSAQAQLEGARLRLDFAVLRAPAAGVISQRLVQPGQVVAAGTVLLQLIRDGRLEWRAELPERDLLRVAPGMALTVRGPGGDAVTGRVRAVAPSLNVQSRTGLVYADLPEPGALKAGMFAQGELQLGSAPARTVPDEAVVERDGYRYVFVLGADGAVAQRRIEAGARDGGVVEVLGGLAAEDQVVVQGAGFLSDGDRVRVVPAQD